MSMSLGHLAATACTSASYLHGCMHICAMCMHACMFCVHACLYSCMDECCKHKKYTMQVHAHNVYMEIEGLLRLCIHIMCVWSCMHWWMDGCCEHKKYTTHVHARNVCMGIEGLLREGERDHTRMFVRLHAYTCITHACASIVLKNDPFSHARAHEILLHVQMGMGWGTHVSFPCLSSSREISPTSAATYKIIGELLQQHTK